MESCGLAPGAVLQGFSFFPRGGSAHVVIPSDDEKALVEVLVTALRCPNERRARADAAHALVRRGYSWQAVADKVADVYKAVRRT